MNNKYKLLLFILAIIIFTILTVKGLDYDDAHYRLVSPKGCSTIIVDYDEGMYLVHYVDNTNEMLDYIEQHTTKQDIKWAISEMQDICFTHHNH